MCAKKVGRSSAFIRIRKDDKASHFFWGLTDESSSVTQCNADCSHIGTLLALAGVAADDAETLGRYVEIIRSRDPMSCSYPGASKKFQEMMDNLARCAHNRLVTSNWLFGYRPIGQNKGEVSPIEAARQKLTRYMAPWEECDSVTRLLAYTVVDTSFIIAAGNAGKE